MQAKPFQPEATLLNLPAPHPDPASFQAAAGAVSRRSREVLVRLWLTEGTPFAFRACPAVYEELRGWLGQRLEVCPKEVPLLGSARIGFSLAPQPTYGRPFGPNSDLDFSVVSERLFGEISATFARWKADYKAGLVTPRGPTERRYWDANIEFGRTNLPQGFFDVAKLPTRDRYPIIQQIRQAMWVLLKKLAVTPGAPAPRRDPSACTAPGRRSWQGSLSTSMSRSQGPPGERSNPRMQRPRHPGLTDSSIVCESTSRLGPASVLAGR